MELAALYLIVGACAGVLAGMLGIGGGLILVPALAYSFQLQGISEAHIMPLALGTSLGAIVLTAISSVIAHQRHGAVQWPAFRQLLPGLLIGAALGATLASLFDSVWLRRLFGMFELLVAIQMLSAWRPNAQRHLPGTTGMLLTGGSIGALSALLGIGGGTLSVPFLVWCNMAMRQAVATAAACGLPIALAGASGYLLQGWQAHDLPSGSTGYLYWPALLPITLASLITAPLGAWLTHHLPTALLKRLFALILVALGLKMLAVI